MKFRKKPVVIDTIQWTGDNLSDIQAFYRPNEILIGNQIMISTLEGAMLANKGDWIIKDVKGEFYPCKPDIFEATYESASAPTLGQFDQDEINKQEATEKLAKFGLAVLEESRDELADLDGGWLQDKAEEFGILIPFEATEPCGDNCRCADVGDWPLTCYRYSEAVHIEIERRRAK